jgi:hypothetical protein
MALAQPVQLLQPRAQTDQQHHRYGHRQAAQPQAPDHTPVDLPGAAVDAGRHGLGQGGEPEIGGHRSDRQQQQRHHQRTASHAGQADDKTGQRSTQAVADIKHGREVRKRWRAGKAARNRCRILRF